MGNKNSTPTAVTKYSHDTQKINDILRDLQTKSETNYSNYTNAYNKASNGKMTVVVQDAENTNLKFKNKTQQIINAAVTNCYADAFESILKSTYGDDVKLDALASISNSAVDSSVFEDNGSDVDVRIIDDVTTTVQDVQSIINSVNFCSSTKINNEASFEDIEVLIQRAKNTTLSDERQIQQIIVMNTNSIAEIARNATSLTDTQLKEIVNNTLDANQSTDTKGFIENTGNAAGNVIDKTGNAIQKAETGFMLGLTTPIIIVIVVVIVIFIIFFSFIIILFKRR
jgi:hypothetical protein